MCEIRPCTVAEIERSERFGELLALYGAESSMPEMGEVRADFAAYRAMEGTGLLHAIGAFEDDLVGLITVIVYRLPHYGGRCVCSTESFFVDPEHRNGGVGLKLLRAAEDLARSLGASALMVSAPAGGRLAKVLPRTGYRDASHVFVRALA